MEIKMCQSCAMPLSDEILGTNEDGSKNEEYCSYCLKDGAFVSMYENILDYCLEHSENWGENLNKEEAQIKIEAFLKTLKRWQN